MNEMGWGWSIGLAVLCPLLLAPPIIYYQCLTLKKVAQQKQDLAEANTQLQAALDQVDELRSLLPFCAWCHKVRDDTGYWERVETFIERSTRSSITHGVCPECRDRVLQDWIDRSN